MPCVYYVSSRIMILDRRKMKFASRKRLNQQKKAETQFGPAMPIHVRKSRWSDHGYNIYDALVVSAALGAGCTTLYSEDLHDGQTIDEQLTIRNPFVGSSG
jgi:predicted nucleic acid-binding protein